MSQKPDSLERDSLVPTTLLGERIPGLRARLIERTAGDIAESYQLLARGDGEALAEMARLAHNIHGAAASFGLSAVASCAGDLEALIKRRATARTARATSGLIAQAGKQLARLEGALRAARRNEELTYARRAARASRKAPQD